MKKHNKPKKSQQFISEKDTITFYSQFCSETETPYSFDDLTKKAEYQSTKTIPRYSAHIGQLKLFLAEIQFLTQKAAKGDIVIYIGSAPANKIQFVSELFPTIRFILIDPKEHKVEGAIYSDSCADIQALIENNPDTKYFIIEKEFTDEMAEQLRFPHLFISDIRTVLGDNTDKAEPSDLDILWNSAQNLNWISIMRPKSFMLKFRCPYLINDDSIRRLNEALQRHPNVERDFERCAERTGIDFVANFRAKKYIFIDYDLLALQAFAPSHSTETRLICSEIRPREYDILDYEQKMFYYNIAYRSIGVSECCHSSEIGIDNCHDCALMMRIFAEYGKIDVDDIVSRLLATVDRNLLECGSLHGIARSGNLNHSEMIKAYMSRYISADDQSIKLVSPVDAIRRLVVRQRVNDDRLLRMMPLYDMFGYNTTISMLKHLHYPEYNKLTQILAHKYNERDIVEICRANHISKNNIIRETFGATPVFAKMIEEYAIKAANGMPIIEIAEISQLKSKSRFIGIYENKLYKVLGAIECEFIVAYIVGAETTLLFYIYELLKKCGKPTLFIMDINDSVFDICDDIDGRLFVCKIRGNL